MSCLHSEWSLEVTILVAIMVDIARYSNQSGMALGTASVALNIGISRPLTQQPSKTLWWEANNPFLGGGVVPSCKTRKTWRWRRYIHGWDGKCSFCSNVLHLTCVPLHHISSTGHHDCWLSFPPIWRHVDALSKMWAQHRLSCRGQLLQGCFSS